MGPPRLSGGGQGRLPAYEQASTGSIPLYANNVPTNKQPRGPTPRGTSTTRGPHRPLPQNHPHRQGEYAGSSTVHGPHSPGVARRPRPHLSHPGLLAPPRADIQLGPGRPVSSSRQATATDPQRQSVIGSSSLPTSSNITATPHHQPEVAANASNLNSTRQSNIRCFYTEAQESELRRSWTQQGYTLQQIDATLNYDPYAHGSAADDDDEPTQTRNESAAPASHDNPRNGQLRVRESRRRQMQEAGLDAVGLYNNPHLPASEPAGRLTLASGNAAPRRQTVDSTSQNVSRIARAPNHPTSGVGGFHEDSCGAETSAGDKGKGTHFAYFGRPISSTRAGTKRKAPSSSAPISSPQPAKKQKTDSGRRHRQGRIYHGEVREFPDGSIRFRAVGSERWGKLLYERQSKARKLTKARANNPA